MIRTNSTTTAIMENRYSRFVDLTDARSVHPLDLRALESGEVLASSLERLIVDVQLRGLLLKVLHELLGVF